MANKKLEMAGRKLVTITNPRSHVAEQFRTLRTNINFSSPDKAIQSIVVTSASPFEGKSTTAANLAIVFAQEGRRVLLIDGDMRKPTVHHTFRLQNSPGLSSVLTRHSMLNLAIKGTYVENLDVLTCGPIPPNPAELLSSKAMDSLLVKVKNIYDLVIFDSPPILSVADSQIISNKCEGTILVLKSRVTDKTKAMKAKEMISLSNSQLIGVVLNNFEVTGDKGAYYYT